MSVRRLFPPFRGLLKGHHVTAKWINNNLAITRWPVRKIAFTENHDATNNEKINLVTSIMIKTGIVQTMAFLVMIFAYENWSICVSETRKISSYYITEDNWHFCNLKSGAGGRYSESHELLKDQTNAFNA